MTNHRLFQWFKFLPALASLIFLTLPATAAPKPLHVLLITGGCCHDYAAQKDILKKGIEARANVIVDQVHTDDSTTHPPLAILGNPDYAKGYDLVIHDECAADISDPALIEMVLKPHRDGIPAVNLHCAMHCYRVGNPNDPVTLGTPHGLWFEYLGLQSSGHGKQIPISLTFTDTASPITKGMSNWTTIHEELYNNIHIFDKTHPLARGKQVTKQKDGSEKVDDFVVVWTNEYGPKKTRVFSTTIGHNNETVSDPRYLDLVTRGVLWATGHLKKDGTPAKGYGPQVAK
ncbi:MAG TPA: ThuA domain-containing protein [Verrucomicrobiae bacterium]|nr:ThuA domain-containing protein [Verrucomicrobiae bacterium]